MKKLFFGLKAMLVAVRQTVQVYRKVLAGYWCRKDDERDSGDAQLAIDRIVAQTDILRSALQAVILHGRPVILITDQGERIGYVAVSFSRGAEGVI